MTDRLDPRPAALERRLERASPAVAPAGLRRRILSAIEDSVPGTESGGDRHVAHPNHLLSVAGTVCFTVVAAAMVAVVIVAMGSAVRSAGRLTLVERARIAGMGDDMIGTLGAESRGANPAVESTRADDNSPLRDTLRVLDGPRLLRETL